MVQAALKEDSFELFPGDIIYWFVRGICGYCLGAEVVFDYAATGLTLRTHPVALLRERLVGMKLFTAAELRDAPHGRLVRACGIVVTRQQPQTAKGVVFVTLEAETGSVNVMVWKSLREKQRAELLHLAKIV